jgi:hypothetical protein
VRGVDRDVLFLSHKEPELQDTESSALGSSSKINPYEASMVVGITCHLQRQGYSGP